MYIRANIKTLSTESDYLFMVIFVNLFHMVTNKLQLRSNEHYILSHNYIVSKFITFNKISTRLSLSVFTLHFLTNFTYTLKFIFLLPRYFKITKELMLFKKTRLIATLFSIFLLIVNLILCRNIPLQIFIVQYVTSVSSKFTIKNSF